MLNVLTVKNDNLTIIQMEKTKFDNYPIGKTKQNFKMTIILNGKQN